MNLTSRLIKNLREILQGESIPYSALPDSLSESLVSEGYLNVEYHGSRRSLRTHNAKALVGALTQYNEVLRNIDAAELMISGESSRSVQAAISGNSKIRSERSCPGFLVNSYCRIGCQLNGKAFVIEPVDGSALYIADWKTFVPPADTLIVGVENMENFLKIRFQMELFSSCIHQGESQILFVARYSFSSDLAQWLKCIPNRYIHFGDFDLAGINIFLTQFLPSVGKRGSFLIPPDIEERLSRGSRQRYDEQYAKYHHLTTSDPHLSDLISLIHHFRRAYDQEGYIKIKQH